MSHLVSCVVEVIGETFNSGGSVASNLSLAMVADHDGLLGLGDSNT